MNQVRNKYKKRAAVAALLSVSLLATGSLAWRDLSQYKTNKFMTSGVEHNVVLVENFQEVANWRVGQTMKKEVSVRNGQESDDPSKYLYENALIRVQFKEFMDIGSKNYIFNQERLMINTSGDFIRFMTEQDAREYMNTNKLPNETRIKQVKGYYDGNSAPADGYYYIATQLNDQNGQFGKFLVIGVEANESVSLVDGIAKGNPGSSHTSTLNPHVEQTNQESYKIDENAWSVHKWGTDANLSYAEESAFTNYVRWSLGNDVITSDAWDKKPVEKWILDTNSEQGWAYWGTPLAHGKTAIENKTITGKILEQVQLIQQPSDNADYFINVSLDAVSAGDLDKWTDAPSDVLTSLKNQTDVNSSKIALKKSMDEALLIDASGISTPSGVELRDALANADAVYNNNFAEIIDIVSARTRLNRAIEVFLNDGTNVKRLAFNKKITETMALDTADKTKQSVKFLQDTIAEARMVQANTSATDQQIDAMSASIDQAIAKLNVLVGLEAYPVGIAGINNHYYVEFAETKWEVVGFSLDNAILRAAPLSESQFEKMGVSNLLSRTETNSFGNHNVMNFGSLTTLYPDSNVFKAHDAFYKTFIEGKTEEDMVVPVFIDSDNQIETNEYSAQTLVNDARGMKQVFAGSRFDTLDGHQPQYRIFSYPDNTPIWGGGSFWNRTTAGTLANAISPRNGVNDGVNKSRFYYQVRPMIAVKNVSLPFSDSVLN